MLGIGEAMVDASKVGKLNCCCSVRRLQQDCGAADGMDELNNPLTGGEPSMLVSIVDWLLEVPLDMLGAMAVVNVCIVF